MPKKTKKKSIKAKANQGLLEKISAQKWFGLFCLAVFLGLIALGTWQLNRLEWKKELIAVSAENNSLPALTKIPDDITNLEFRKVSLEGTFINEKEIGIAGKYRAKKAGYDLITPFKTSDGKYIFVNRGWVPSDKKSYKSRGEKPKESAKIEGYIRTKFKSPLKILPQNQPDKDLWLWMDLSQISEHVKTKGLSALPVLIYQTGWQNPDNHITINTAKIEFMNDHLQYAITWYCLAVITIIMYLVFVNSSKK